MKKKYSRILGVALTLMLLASLFGFAAPVSAANVGWSGIANPSASPTRLNLADCDVGPIAVSPDGNTLFAAVETEARISGISTAAGQWALLQSTDGGHNWRATGLIMNPGPITGIAISPNFATDGTMYVAAGSVPLAPAPAVFRSQNSGTSFVELKAVPIDAGATPTTFINSIDMWPASPYAYVMVGTDSDVWVIQDAPFGVWLDQEIAIGAGVWVNVVEVAFAPDFATTNYIWAVVGNDSGSAIFGNVTCTNSPGAWGTLLADTGPILAAAAAGASIGFPSDYNSATSPYLWVGLDSGAPNLGGVWRIRGLPLPSANSQFIRQYGGAPVAGTAAADIRSIAVSGGMAAATILAGQQDTAAIVGSLNGGVTWMLPVMKQPTGANTTYVVMAPDFATSNLAYVATSDFDVDSFILEKRDDATAVLVDTGIPAGYSGQYAVKFTMPAHPDWGDMAKVYVRYGQALSTIATEADLSFTYYSQVGAADPFPALYLDTDDNGLVDFALGGKRTAIQTSGEWVTTEPYVDANPWNGCPVNEVTGVVTNNQDWQTLEYWKTNKPGVIVYVALEYGGPTNHDNAVLYVDDITIRGATYELEQESNFSAFQVSRNGGMSFNQTGLIDDTTFSDINDVAVVSLDTIFMVSDNYSLWKTTDATATKPVWERILTGGTVTLTPNPLAGNIAFVATSPAFATDGVVYATNATRGVMKASDGGDIFAALPATLADITALHVVDATFAYHGALAQFYRTDDGGYSWLAATTAPLLITPSNIISIATAPAGAMPPGQLMVGAANGSVFMSVNRGVSFFPLGFGVTTGSAHVAFDAGYATNSTVYAGGGDIIARFNVAVPTAPWVTIDGTTTMPMPTGPTTAASDAFTITDSGAGDSGTITVTSGAVSVAFPTGCNVGGIAGPDTLTLAAGMTGVTWSTAAGAQIVVTASIAGAAGLWTVASTSTALVSSADPDGDAFVAPNGGAWSLPDVTGVGAATASTITGLVTSPDGTLYGSNLLTGQGMERSLNPTAALTAPVEGATAPVFERATSALATYATFNGLWLVVDETLDVVGSKNVFFAIDETGVAGIDRIMTYTDTLATPVVLTGPEDGAVFARETAVTLDWERLTGALSYRWEIARDALFFLPVDSGFSGYPTDTSILLGAGRTYYWRVRVDGTPAGAPGLPVLSRWSETRTFTTLLGARPWHPFSNMAGVAPGPGASDVLTKPTFQWNGADWATSYEFVLADNAAFTGATTKTLTVTSWVCDTDLGYSATWYWKVRALSATSQSEWSDVGVFTTMAEPVEPTPPVVIQDVPDIVVEQPDIIVQEVTPVAPGYLLAIIIIGAVLAIFVIVLIVRTRRPI